MSCPICGEDSLPDYRPFCSRKCAYLDLGKWFSDSYAIPSDAPEDDAENPAETSESDAPPAPKHH